MGYLVFFGLPVVLLVLGFPIFLILLVTSIVAVLTVSSDIPTDAIQTYMFGSLDNFPLLAVPFFVLAGEIMAQGGIARRIINMVMAIVGGIRGSLAVTTVAASELFGAMSHTAVGTVVAGDRTARMTNLDGPRSTLLLDRVAADMAGAVSAVDAFWGTDWPRDITVVATGSQPQFEAQAGGGPAGQWADIAAVAVAERVDPGRRIAIGQRIVFAPGAVDMSERALRIVLSHELFHYAARADTAVDAPRWLTEGVADYVARPHTAQLVVTPIPTALPSDADLAAPGPARSQGYDRAWWFALFVADTRGAATLRALYRAACGVGHADLPTALRAVLGTGEAGVLADWQQWLTR